VQVHSSDSNVSFGAKVGGHTSIHTLLKPLEAVAKAVAVGVRRRRCDGAD
jgi:hypothetical protein